MFRALMFTVLLFPMAAVAESVPERPSSERSALAPVDHQTEPLAFESASGERVDAEIGRFMVPENRSAETPRQIRLTYVRFPSTSKRPGSPIVYLAGGPGGSGINAARGGRFRLFQALRAYGDVIAFDQRGTGRSEPDLGCSELYWAPFDRPLEQSTMVAAVHQATKACVARLTKDGVDLEGYTSQESANDLEALRRALGAEKLTLWGISYGTHLALATVRAHGEHIDRLILAGLEGLDQSWKLPSDQQALLEEIARLAAGDPQIHGRLPDMLASIRDLLAELASSPQTVTLNDPVSGMGGPMKLGPLDLQFVLANMLRGPESFAVMPDFILRLVAGDWIALGLSSVQARMGRAPGAMGVAMDCASGASEQRLRRIEAEASATLLADAINLPFPGICDAMPVGDLGAGFRAPLRSKVPALLISGTLDGRTPARNAVAIMKGLPNAQHLVIEGAGHSDPLFLSSPKILEAMERFLGGKAQTIRSIKLSPVDFVPPRTVVELPSEKLDRYVGSYQIAEGDVRKVMRAGSLLFTQRGEGRPLPIRPSGDTTFFYEGGSATHLRFDLNSDGQVIGMTMFGNEGDTGEMAAKID